MQRPEHEIVALGEFSETLMRSDAFNTLYEEFERGSINTLLTSLPHEVKAREHEYARITALRDFLNHLAAYAKSAADIKARNELEQQEAEEADVADFDD